MALRGEWTTKRRREEVEALLRSGHWSEAKIAALVKESGFARRTLYRDRDDILARLAQEEAADIPSRRAAFLLDLRAVKDEAREAKSFSSAAKLLSMEAQILGLDRAPLPTVEAESAETVDTSLEGALSEVRRLRRRAEAGDSYVAAERLLDREVSLLIEIRRRDEEERRANRDGMSEDELTEALIEAAGTLPAPLRSKLLAALTGA